MKSFAGRAIQLGLKKLGFQITRWNPRARIRAPELAPELLERCRVFPSREHWLSTLPKGGKAAELGVDFGAFSRSIIRIVEPEILYLVDAWESKRFKPGFDVVRSRFRQEIEAGGVRIKQGYSTDILATFEDAHLDWVYIDTTHSYDVTRAELSACARVVKQGGRIAGHDYCEGSVLSGKFYGVNRALHEFCIERNWAFESIGLSPHGRLTYCIREGRLWP